MGRAQRGTRPAEEDRAYVGFTLLRLETMRVLLATALVLACFPSHGWAQDAPGPRVPITDAGVANNQAILHRPSTPSGDADNRAQQWMKKVRPLQDRIIQNERLRSTASVVGLGIAAYEATRGRPTLPLGFMGTEALRLGFSRQLALIRRESGYVVEPSIGPGSFAITFRKRLD
jgi:hypothetical protein